MCCLSCPDFDICNLSCDEAQRIGKTGTCSEMVEQQDDLQVIDKALPKKVAELTDLMISIKKAEAKVAEIKEALLKAMEEQGVKKFENDKIAVTYVAPSTRSTFDRKRLEADHPELDLKKYNKTSSVKASVRIVVK
jgi:peptidoglycan hydrolase CwlO-like protein